MTHGLVSFLRPAALRSCLLSLCAGLALAACARSEPPQLESRLGTQPGYGYKGGRANGGNFAGHQGREAAGSENAFKATAGDIVYFSSDSSDITPEGQQTLSAQARWLQNYPSQTVTIEGHADERGTREYNIALGAKRATSVKTFLASQGVNAARIRTVSYGKERPVASCDDISCWSKNRRAQTILANVAVSRN